MPSILQQNRIRHLQFAAPSCAIRCSPFAIWHSQLNFEWQSNRVQFVECVPCRGVVGGGSRWSEARNYCILASVCAHVCVSVCVK